VKNVFDFAQNCMIAVIRKMTAIHPAMAYREAMKRCPARIVLRSPLPRRCGCSNATREQVVEAAKKVRCDDSSSKRSPTAAAPSSARAARRCENMENGFEALYALRLDIYSVWHYNKIRKEPPFAAFL